MSHSDFDHGSHTTLVREPVFDGLIAPRSEGFVQIDWVPRENSPLPRVIEEESDVDGNSTPDMIIKVDVTSGSTCLTAMREWVLKAERLIVAGKERILRIRLRNHS